MLAASGYETLGLVKDGVDVGSFLPLLAVGLVSAGVVGWLSIKWLLGYLNRHSLYVFAIYCAVLGLICTALTFIR
jgi:undecaprenyl-diphosphatase